MNAAFTFGADPEIFVQKGGESFSAHGLVKGDKENPQKVEGGAVQVDGMALEFNIDPTASTDFEGFNRNVVTVMRTLAKLAKETDPDINLNLSPVQEFSQEFLDAQPDEAKELGCDPDYNAYTMKENPRPDGERPFRTGAGHLHVGWGADIPTDNEQHHEICASFVKMLDVYVGLYMTILDRDPRRRELYGQAGAYRAKPYGVEYRTPSNMWLKTKGSRRAIHDLMRMSISSMRSGYTPDGWLETRGTTVPDVINSGDWKKAYKILKSVYPKHLKLPADITSAYLEAVQEEKEGL